VPTCRSEHSLISGPLARAAADCAICEFGDDGEAVSLCEPLAYAELIFGRPHERELMALWRKYGELERSVALNYSIRSTRLATQNNAPRALAALARPVRPDPSDFFT
jgi:hypothetical protein